MKVSKGVSDMMRAKRIASNIYKLLGNISVGDVTSFKFNNDATKL